MKKISLLLLLVVAGVLAMSAQPAKAPMRSAIFDQLPNGFVQLGNTSLYYNISPREAAGPGAQTGVSILGKIGNVYYSSTYEANGIFGAQRAGAGFIAAFQVNNGTASYLDAANGSTIDGVTVTTRLEPQGDVAARIIYTVTNNNNAAVNVNAGVWGDIMIGDNDRAPLACLKNDEGATYGIDMKYTNTDNTPRLYALFGDGITGVTPSDDYWFGHFYTNFTANKIVGNYSSENNYGIFTDYSQYYMVENGNYDSGLGFCWKNREVPAGESIELSYLVSVGEVPFEPVDPEPGEDRFTYEVWADNFEGWNDLSVAHPAHIKGYYEHPFGQEGYIEYLVDAVANEGLNATNEWIRIETPLTSGEDYQLDFDMFFDEYITDVHTLHLRFTLGVGDYTELDGLQWVDVRSIDAENIPTLVYNGEPQIFTITVGGTDYAIGTDVDYIYPGTYTAVTILGNYDENTIGINNIDFTIDKAPGVVNVEVPEDTKYDGEAHGATATVPEGSGEVTIYYTDVLTGEKTTEAPVEVGDYVVSIVVTEGDYYYGIEETICGEFKIYESVTAVNEIITDNKDNSAWYTIDGIRVAAPTQPGLYIHNGKKYIVK